MAFRCLRTFKAIRTSIIYGSPKCTSVTVTNSHQTKQQKPVQCKTENNMIYLEDPDVFGTLSKNIKIQEDIFEDEGDVKEHEFLTNIPLPSQKLTIKQYSDIIKQYVKHKRLKEALDVLDVRMLTIDRVKPENYIYNILIGACADVGYTKKAFKLYNDMKRRALKPTGDTYTCLFEACANSPWAADGLKNASNLRKLMIEKGIEPNLTNYNAMIKAFGRCGDLPTAFQIVDEMMSKKIKIRVHTFNHLLHACITDKAAGLRHALVVWRKMLKMREKPNLFSFNLMLKCVKECNLGSKEDIEELIGSIKSIAIDGTKNKQPQISSSAIESAKRPIQTYSPELPKSEEIVTDNLVIHNNSEVSETHVNSELETVSNNNQITILDKGSVIKIPASQIRSVPNLLSKVAIMNEVQGLQEVHTVQDKFAIIGGQDDFLKEMEVYSVKPDIKTFTQMLPLLDETCEAENKLLEVMNACNVKADIDFYNILIKKRCMRRDYDSAIEVKSIIENENKIRKKKHPMKKKLRLKFNIMTYGVLAMTCLTKESAEKLLNEMKEMQLKVNIEILGTLLRSGTVISDFEYISFIMKKVQEENLKVNEPFLRHLEIFTDKCRRKMEQISGEPSKGSSNGFVRAFSRFSNFYKTWLKEVNAENVLKTEHPWQQFRENYPETVQRTNVVIREPKRFYKRNKKFVKYAPST